MSIQRPTFAELVDPGNYSIEEAEKLALQMMEEGQRIPERCALAMQGQPPPEHGRAERMIELLPRLAPPVRLLPLLDRIMPCSNARLRSKAWKLYAEASADLDWALERIEDEDARVAANLVEALWRAKPSGQLREVFRRAAEQERNRVAGNGLVGLFQLDDPEAEGIAGRLAQHADPRFRASVAWVIGRVYWREGLELLQELWRDPVASVRANAERSLLRLVRRFPGAA